jgi:hypothetical protein
MLEPLKELQVIQRTGFHQALDLDVLREQCDDSGSDIAGHEISTGCARAFAIFSLSNAAWRTL